MMKPLQRIALIAALVFAAAVTGWSYIRAGWHGGSVEPATQTVHEVHPSPPSRRTAGFRAHAVHGTVTSNRGVALEGAMISALGDGLVSTRSSASGAWTLQLAPGEHQLVATAPGYAPSPPITVRSDEDGPVAFVLIPRSNTLAGIIHDATGGVVADAIVALESLPGKHSEDGCPLWPKTYSTISDDEGVYDLALCSAQVEVTVTHPDYVAANAVLSVGEGSHAYDFTLAPAGAVSGTAIMVDTERPVPSAVVEAGEFRTTTDGEGRFRMVGLPPGALTLHAYAAGLVSTGDLSITLETAEQRDDLLLLMEPANALVGKIVQKNDGKPVGGATVRSLGGHARRRTTHSMEDGTFELPGMTRGEHVLRVDAVGYLEAIATVHVGDKLEPVTVELDRGAWLEGRVDPPKVAAVEAIPQSLPLAVGSKLRVTYRRSTTADDDGRFSVGPLPPGDIELVAVAVDGSEGRLTVPVDAGSVVIELEPRHRLAGTLVNDDGRPLAHARVDVVPASGVTSSDPAPEVARENVRSTVTALDGTFELLGLRARGYRFVVLDVSQQRLEVRVPAGGFIEVPSHDLRDVDVRVLGNTGSITGTVRLATANDEPDAWVKAIPQQHEIWSIPVARGVWIRESVGKADTTVFADHGHFQISGLASTTYTVEATTTDHEWHGTVEDVQAGDVIEIPMRRTSVIEGRVRRDGRPVRRFDLQIEGPSASSMRVADDGGWFRASHLRAGSYQVLITDSGASTGTRVDIADGQQLELSFELVANGMVRGYLVDEERRGMPAKQVLAVYTGQDGLERLPARATTTADGKFSITVAPGELRLVLLDRPFRSDAVLVDAGASVDVGRLEVRRALDDFERSSEK